MTRALVKVCTALGAKFTLILAELPGVSGAVLKVPTENGGSAVTALIVKFEVPVLVTVTELLAVLPKASLGKLIAETLTLATAPVLTPVPLRGRTMGASPVMLRVSEPLNVLA